MPYATGQWSRIGSKTVVHGVENFRIVKHTRYVTRQIASGRFSTRLLTTWDVVNGSELISEWSHKRDAIIALRQVLEQ